jgi:cyclohexadienyl dehydratase
MRLLAVLIALLLANGASAQSRLDDIAARGTLRVGLTGDYRPFSELDKHSGAYSGLDVDMANNLEHEPTAPIRNVFSRRGAV